ncbi:helix-turn-helix domain-containing protein [Aquimarina rhabdastrellae]
MNTFPILNINQFKGFTNSAHFYANDFKSHYLKNQKKICVPHKHDFFLTVIFTQGSGIHEIDFNRYEIKPGTVFMLKPGQMHNWELSEDIDGYIFFHTQSFYDLTYTQRSVTNYPFYYSSQNAPLIHFSSEVFEGIIPFFKCILNEYRTDQLLKQNKICSLIDLIYIEISRHYLQQEQNQTSTSSHYALKVQELELLIDTHFIQEKSPHQYAEWMHMSTNHLNRITKAVLNKTTTELITDRVILEAKRLLIHSKESFAIIASKLGYDDYAYFSRIFKNKCNETPSQFLRKYQ